MGELPQRVRARTLEALQHQAMPFEQVVEFVRPRHSLAYAPVFQVMFAWQNAVAFELALPGLTVARLSMPHAKAKFDLTLNLNETDGGIVGTLDYATALRDRTTAERYVEYLRRLLTAMAADDSQSA